MILNDKQITELAHKGMIRPFVGASISRGEPMGVRKVMSYGVSSYGYDLRLSPRDFQIFHRPPGIVINPKRFDTAHLESVALQSDNDGHFFILPANSYGLGVAVEQLDLPPDVIAVCVGKSSYARCGIIANVTPAEPGWRGHLTLEFSNSSASDCRLYVNEGVVQMLFFRGEPCSVSYNDRMGKYQGQPEEVCHVR